MIAQATAFGDLGRADTVLLTTIRRDGTPVGTPVHLAVAGGRAYFRSFDAAGKVKRLRRNPVAEVAPITPCGQPLSPALSASIQELSGDDARIAAKLLSTTIRFCMAG